VIRPRKLSVQLVVWFSAIALVPLSIVTISTYLASKSALHDQVTTGLFAMASRQSNQLATYVREREQNVATLSRMPGAIDALDDLRRATDGRESGPALDILDRQYRPFSPTTRKPSAMTTSPSCSPTGASPSRRSDGFP